MRISMIFETPGYIANPYWPEMARLIDIQKKSGMNRARTEEGVNKALRKFLETLDMSYNDYLQLHEQAHRPFHLNGASTIVIPGDIFLSCLVNAAYVATSAIRLAKAETIRTLLKASAFDTGKTAPDGVWERFARHEATNQRGLRTNPYIKDFTATGEVTYPKDLVKPETLVRFIAFAGSDVGIGASRKMGWGRFKVQVEE